MHLARLNVKVVVDGRIQLTSFSPFKLVDIAEFPVTQIT